MAKKKIKPKISKQSTPAKQASITDSINQDVIAAALSSVNQPVLVKVCRLCESKDGPFLNIFDADKVTAKKIEELMPFWIAENDDLPHKICFRCSAKVEELYEFIQKCIKTQNNLRTAVGKSGPLVTKTKTRTMWEEKLNKTNMTNDDICDALIKKAMEGIKDIPLNTLPLEDKKPSPMPTVAKKIKNESVKKEKDISDADEPDMTLKQLKLSIEKIDQKSPVTRNSRANNSEALLEGLVTANNKKLINKQPGSTKKPHNSNQEEPESKTPPSVEVKEKSKPKVRYETAKPSNSVEIKEKNKSNIIVDDEDSTESAKSSKLQEVQKHSEKVAAFNIMDHVSTIKVNGVGILFQCKLCNRNFLKKEVVITHGCAKNSVPKVEFIKHIPPPELPKTPTVKYIKIDDEFKKSLANNSKKDTENKTKPSASEVRPKPKIGPASKVKRDSNITKPQTLPQETPSPLPSSEKIPNVQNTLLPTVNFPTMPSLNSRYKLVPGPDNTFTLIEDVTSNENENKAVEENSIRTKVDKKRKVTDDIKTTVGSKPKDATETKCGKVPSPEVIDLEELRPSPPVAEQPYPVGLFQTVPHHSSIYVPPVAPQPQIFTTPAMKKQSYTIVQTGNPSKLLISTKPQPQTPVEDVPRKRQKRVKPDVPEVSKEPFSVTLEDNEQPKNAGFFTFINVDPLLQPSYVLPTHNIIQESQISTSTPIVKGASDNKDKDKYSCNMCGEKFSREKKLLTHIQSHYSKMDEEDQLRAEKNTKKRGRKS